MLKSEIKVGGFYKGKINGKVVTVRVDGIREVSVYRHSKYVGLKGNDGKFSLKVVYDVTNMVTGRKTTFRSAAKFRCVATAPVSC